MRDLKNRVFIYKKTCVLALAQLLALVFFSGAMAQTIARDYTNDFLLSQIAFELTTGDKQELVVLDIPRAGKDDQAFCRDDLTFDILTGDDVVSVTRELLEGEEYESVFLNALGEGVAEILISYPGYQGQDTVIVVNVTAADHSGPEADAIILLSKYDIIYFDEGDETPYTFGYTADPGATVSVAVNGISYLPESGIFTVPLTDGYNPIILTAVDDTGTTVRVYNVRAKALEYEIINNTRPEQDLLYEGDIIGIGVTGLVTPVPKVSRVYNPAAMNLSFLIDMPRYYEVFGAATQYEVDLLEIEMTEAGVFTLTNGLIEESWFGAGLYAEAPVGTQPPNLAADQPEDRFSFLPDIELTVLENEDYLPELLTVNLENTEEIWPGDIVTLTIPDLDLPYIDYQHPADPVGGWWIASIIKTYTIFATDIPGLESVTSKEAEHNDELARLKTIQFVVPEDTPPGDYRVRGGYVHMKYGPSWWTRKTRYFSGEFPDVDIRVVESVPGQVHGELDIQNNEMKNRLAVAAGKGQGYTGNLTSGELKSITGTLDLSGTGLTDEDMKWLQYLEGVTDIDLSGNPAITSASVDQITFDWTIEKRLDFSGCTGITELDAEAFKDCANLKAIVLPQTLTRLGERCFENCTSLAEIILPEGVTSLGHRCFAGCSNLVYAYLPDSLLALDVEGENASAGSLFSSCIPS